MKEEYDPKKLFPVEVKKRAATYYSPDPLISLNTKSGGFVFNKRARESLDVKGLNKLKVRFLCDGFKLYVDSAVEANDKNFINISKLNTACSMALCKELKKHYEIPYDYKAVFKLIEVEKYCFRLDMQSIKLLK